MKKCGTCNLGLSSKSRSQLLFWRLLVINQLVTFIENGGLLFFCVRAEKAYPAGCSGRDPSFYDYDQYPFPPQDPLLRKMASTVEIHDLPLIRNADDFLVTKLLGTGKFSDVLEAVDLKQKQLSFSNKSCPTKSKPNEDQTHDQPNYNVDPASLVVLKCLKTVSERKIRREVLILKRASRLPNLARLLGVVPPNAEEEGSGCEQTMVALPRMPTLVLKHAGQHSLWLCHNNRRRAAEENGLQNVNDADDNALLSPYEIRFYLFHLLIALDSLHSCGIMHRDVKPRNVLIHRGRLTREPHLHNDRRLMLIDLGLADFYLPHHKYNVRVASRHYKSPELLLGYEWYDYAIDLWGVGCMLAGLLFQREPVFRGKDNLDQLGKIITRLGTSSLIDYILRYNIRITKDVQTLIAQYHTKGALHRRPWTDLLLATTTTSSPRSQRERSTSSSNNQPPIILNEFQLQGIDLVDRLLVYDHDQRLTARQAMQHAFFDPVRDEVLRQVQTTAAADAVVQMESK